MKSHTRLRKSLYVLGSSISLHPRICDTLDYVFNLSLQDAEARGRHPNEMHRCHFEILSNVTDCKMVRPVVKETIRQI